MNFLGLGSSAHVDFAIANVKKRPKKIVMKGNGGGSSSGSSSSRAMAKAEYYIFEGKDDVGGVVTVTPKGRKVEHVGIKIELIGQIEFFEGGQSNEFEHLVRELEGPGILDSPKTFNFNFANVEKPYESYNGLNVRLRYLLRVTVTKSYNNIVAEQDIWVENVSAPPEASKQFKMEVGIEDCLHIEFEYDKSRYHLEDTVIGKVFFILVRIKIKHMELAIQKREAVEQGSGNVINETETLAKYEIMDGAPIRGEKIPVRLFLHNRKITPTYRNINNQFSVRYFLNLVLVDEEDRRYFKSQEITLWRKNVGSSVKVPSLAGSS